MPATVAVARTIQGRDPEMLCDQHPEMRSAAAMLISAES